MTTAARPPARLDHCVLPVSHLGQARARWAAAGFTVAPDGIHPFGTANSCIYFADGTFLEPLAVADALAARQAAAAGNVFVGRDQGFRQAHGEGFSAIVVASDDAKRDDRYFRDSGFGGGDMLTFSRAVVDASGRRDIAGFELAFAAPAPAGAFAFSCQRLASPAIDRASLQSHANGVTGVREIVAVADEPQRHRAFLETVLSTTASVDGWDLALGIGGCCVRVVGPEGFAARFGIPPRSSGLLSYAAIVLKALGDRFAEWPMPPELAPVVRNGLTVVPPGPGQGVVLAFSL